MNSKLLTALDRGVVVCDGSMGATLHNIDLDVERDYLGRENCVDVLVRSRPELIQRLHADFLEVGANAVETDTFGASRHVFAEFDEELVSWTYDINKDAAEIARAACDQFATPSDPRFVLGSMGPGTKLITLGQISWNDMLDSYAEQARGLIDGGVDAFCIETCQDLLQVRCAVNACLRALDERSKTVDDIPILVSVTIETMGTMLVGSDIAAAVAGLRNYPIASLGLNCATGPTEMTEHLSYLAKHWDRHIAVMPNAGLPTIVDGKTSFPLQPAELGEAIEKFINDFGVRLVGGCCGTSPQHIQSVVEAAQRATPGERQIEAHVPSCTSLYEPVEYRQENSFLNIGERLNASGSRRFKRLLEEENWDEMMSLAREQVREGSNVLDVNVDYAGRDNAQDMASLVSRVVRQVDAPLMIDSTQEATIEAGLMHAPGKCIINSTNFEEGDEKFDRLCGLAKTYGAGLVIGSIDEDENDAMARTAERKFEIAHRAYVRATEVHGLDSADLFFDPLVLPISTGMDADRRSALELIRGTKEISETYPEVQITCGLSNVSFGLKPAARVVLNSVLLQELLDAGLTSAIVHSSKILAFHSIPDEQRAAALDLIHDRRHADAGGTGLPEGIDDASFDPLNAFIALFDDISEEGPETQAANIGVEERLRRHVIDGEKTGVHDSLDDAMVRYAPLGIINDHLLEGMKVVGELFGSGQMQLPFVLQSAEVMKMAVKYLEPYMDKVAGETKGTVVLATVKGDVHDIGKNLVDIILTNNGYTVHNIGIKQPLHAIVEAIEKYQPDAVGLSGLLVKSVVVMEENLKELNELSINLPVMLGGAALTRHYAESHLRKIYDGPLYYGRDAFEGMRVCDHLASNDLQTIDDEVRSRLEKRAAVERRVAGGSDDSSETETVVVADAPAIAVTTDHNIPEPPFWGTRVVDQVDLNEIYPYINRVALFRGQWGFKKGSRSESEYADYVRDEVQPVFDRVSTICKEEKLLRPQVVYGWFPCAAAGNDLIVFDPEQQDKELERFAFPRQTKRDRRCLSDFFLPIESGQRDVIGLTCVTVGAEASNRAKALFERDEYTEYLYLHGLSVETAEGLAELWHKRMRMELGFANQDAPNIADLFRQKYRGSRYSPGYPACPEMSDQEIIFRLLRPERIGCALTENWQIDPEQSTSAFVVHHPQAKYFNI